MKTKEIKTPSDRFSDIELLFYNKAYKEALLECDKILQWNLYTSSCTLKDIAKANLYVAMIKFQLFKQKAYLGYRVDSKGVQEMSGSGEVIGGMEPIEWGKSIMKQDIISHIDKCKVKCHGISGVRYKKIYSKANLLLDKLNSLDFSSNHNQEQVDALGNISEHSEGADFLGN